AAAQQRPAQPERGEAEGKQQVIEHRRRAAQMQDVIVGDMGHRQEEPGRAAEPIEMVEENAGEFVEGDGDEREIDAGHAEAEGKHADNPPGEPRDDHAGQHPDPRQHAEMLEERAAQIGAEPEIEGMAEGKLAGEAHHDVPGLADRGSEEKDDEHRQQVIADEPRQRQHDDDEECQRHRDAHRQAEDLPSPHACRPRRPCGRTNSTMMSSAKLNMLLSDGEKKSAASPSETPTSTPPSNAPGMLPSPPTMTMTKARSV